MEPIRRRSALNLRRPVLNEISRSSGSSDQSTEFILVDDDAFVNNDRNISNNQNSNHSIRSLPEEEIIKTRGRKKTKCSPFLRDLSPNSLATIKSPIKNSRNEDLLKFLRSPTPRKCKLKDDTPPIEVKRARKSLIVDLEIEVNGKRTTSTPTNTTGSNKKPANSKKTPNSSIAKKKKFFNLRRSTNVKS